MDRSQTLELYIRSQRGSGVSPDIIREQLQKNGWTDEAIESAFRNVEPGSEEPLPQQPAPPTETVQPVSAQRVSLQPINTVPDIEQLPTRHGGAVSSDQEPATQPVESPQTVQPEVEKVETTQSSAPNTTTPQSSAPTSPPAGPFEALKKFFKRS